MELNLVGSPLHHAEDKEKGSQEWTEHQRKMALPSRQLDISHKTHWKQQKLMVGSRSMKPHQAPGRYTPMSSQGKKLGKGKMMFKTRHFPNERG